MASMASWPRRSRRRPGCRWMAGQLVEAHAVVGDDLGRRGRRPAGPGPRPSRRSSPRAWARSSGAERSGRCRAAAASARASSLASAAAPVGRSAPGSGCAGCGRRDLAAGGPQAHRSIAPTWSGTGVGSRLGGAGSESYPRRRSLVPYARYNRTESGAPPPPGHRPGASGSIHRVRRVDRCHAGSSRRPRSADVGFSTSAFSHPGGRPTHPARAREDQRIDQE